MATLESYVANADRRNNYKGRVIRASFFVNKTGAFIYFPDNVNNT